MFRILAIAAGLFGGLALSQFPEFSQQYLQRLAGAVNELQIIVEDFDAAAKVAGQTRDEALASLPDDGVSGQLKASLGRSFDRFERLDRDLTALRGASPLGRLTMPWNMADQELVRDTWSDYQPAVPATLDGAISAGIGYVLGWGVVGMTFGWVGRRIRRTRQKRIRG